MSSTLQYLDLCTVHHLPGSLSFEACFLLQLRSRLPPSEALPPLPLASGGFFVKLSRVYKSGPELLSVRNKTGSSAQVVPLMDSRNTYSQINVSTCAACQQNFVKLEH